MFNTWRSLRIFVLPEKFHSGYGAPLAYICRRVLDHRGMCTYKTPNSRRTHRCNVIDSITQIGNAARLFIHLDISAIKMQTRKPNGFNFLGLSKKKFVFFNFNKHSDGSNYSEDLIDIPVNIRDIVPPLRNARILFPEKNYIYIV